MKLTLRNNPEINSLTLPQQLKLLEAVQALPNHKTSGTILRRLIHERMTLIQAINCAAPANKLDALVRKFVPGFYKESRQYIVDLLYAIVEERTHRLNNESLKQYLTDCIEGEDLDTPYAINHISVAIHADDLAAIMDVPLNGKNRGLDL